MARIVIISPRLDDAVLSCWSVIDSDADVTVATVYTRPPEPGFLTSWDTDSGALDSHTRVLQRIDEDRAALAVAGRTPHHVGSLEAQYGGQGIDIDTLREVTTNADEVYAPAGYGVVHSHGEHQAVRDVILQIRSDARLYADQPYCGFRPDVALPDELGRGRVATPVELTDVQRRRKLEAL